jgi:glycosyltransferase involved in cell wall biosynthesis
LLTSKNGMIAMPFSPFLFFSLMLKNPKVVIAEGASNFLNSITAFFYCIIFRKKFIWWSLGKLQRRDYDVKRKVIDFIVRFIERKSHKIITYSSEGEKYFLSIGVPQEKIVIAVNVIDTDKVFLRMGDFENRQIIYETKIQYAKKYDFVVLFVGALLKEKSIHLLLEAQKKVEEKYSNVGLLIVGDGPYKNDLIGLSRFLKLRYVEFLGNRVEDNFKFFSIADLFILPGLGGLAISEAMCYKLPVISSIGDGCEMDLVTKENGIVDQELNSEKLFQYVEYFLNNPAQKERFGKKSFEIINSKYNVNNYINKIQYAINN